MADQETFLKNIKKLQLVVEHDSGIHRSLLFKQPGSSTYYFRLTTWSGNLAISGDMGDFIFARTTDMFEFFRSDDQSINLGYWAEKIQACPKSGYKEFSLDKFRKIIREQFEQWDFDSDEDKAAAMEELNDPFDGLLEAHFDSFQEAYVEADGYECRWAGRKFVELWDYNYDEHTYHFIWCCRAIAWGIHKYDLLKEGRTQAAHDVRVLAGKV